MSQHNHTPGPWVYTPSDNRVIRCESNGSLEIAVLPDTTREDAANAALIAAAPDLLGVLEWLLPSLDNSRQSIQYQAVHAVIAKAKGGAP